MQNIQNYQFYNKYIDNVACVLYIVIEKAVSPLFYSIGYNMKNYQVVFDSRFPRRFEIFRGARPLKKPQKGSSFCGFLVF